jgi:hypothetical protein
MYVIYYELCRALLLENEPLGREALLKGRLSTADLLALTS